MKLNSNIYRLFNRSFLVSDLYQFSKFSVIGLSNTLISFCVFSIFSKIFSDFQFKYVFAQAISYSAGVIWSFFWNLHWTFKIEGAAGRSFMAFILIQIIMLISSSVLIEIIIKLLYLQPSLAWVIAMIPITIANFYFSKKFAFKSYSSGSI